VNCALSRIKPRRCDDAEYTYREEEQREDNNIPTGEAIVFLEIYVRDASEFSADLNVQGVSSATTAFFGARALR